MENNQKEQSKISFEDIDNFTYYFEDLEWDYVDKERLIELLESRWLRTL